MKDFIEIAKNCTDKEDVAIALEQAFNKGYSLGYNEGKDNGWRHDLEKDNA